MYSIPNTFGLICKAPSYCEMEALDCQQKISAARESGKTLLVLGAGSNVLFCDEKINALIIKSSSQTIDYQQDPNDSNAMVVTASAGVIWHEFVLATLAKGYYGLENLSLIPGTVGAAPIQNIGAYGVEVGELIERVDCIDLASAKRVCFNREQCQFAYRDSIFKQKYKDQLCIVSVQFRLSKIALIRSRYESLAQQLQGRDPATLSPRDISDAVIAVRRSRLPDPAAIGNAGSFFKNPSISQTQFDDLYSRYPTMPHYPQQDGTVKLAAGWLIEQAGLKGITRGRAGTHEKQALVIVNRGGATGMEILAVAREVKATVQQCFGISLQHEVRILDGDGNDILL